MIRIFFTNNAYSSFLTFFTAIWDIGTPQTLILFIFLLFGQERSHETFLCRKENWKNNLLFGQEKHVRFLLFGQERFEGDIQLESATRIPYRESVMDRLVNSFMEEWGL